MCDGWHSVKTEADVAQLMRRTASFHDSVIAEMCYVSGAFADTEARALYPVNDRRTLRVVLHCQPDDCKVLELEFSGLRQLQLCPVTPDCTCELFDAALFLNDEGVVWCDSAVESASLPTYDGTVIRAEALRYRCLDITDVAIFKQS